MKKIALLSSMLLTLAACKKDNSQQPAPVQPSMEYVTVNREADAHSIVQMDVDRDGHVDFAIGTVLVGDPIEKVDKLQFYAMSGVDRLLLNNENDQSPVLNKGALVQTIHTGYTWFEISHILLVQKVISNTGNRWEGLWKQANHQYLPVQIRKNGELFHGWIELSMDVQSGKLTVHRTGISKEPAKPVMAGF